MTDSGVQDREMSGEGRSEQLSFPRSSEKLKISDLIIVGVILQGLTQAILVHVNLYSSKFSNDLKLLIYTRNDLSALFTI